MTLLFRLHAPPPLHVHHHGKIPMEAERAMVPRRVDKFWAVGQLPMTEVGNSRNAIGAPPDAIGWAQIAVSPAPPALSSQLSIVAGQSTESLVIQARSGNHCQPPSVNQQLMKTYLDARPMEHSPFPPYPQSYKYPWHNPARCI